MYRARINFGIKYVDCKKFDNLVYQTLEIHNEKYQSTRSFY